MSITRYCHNHTLQTNPWHREDKAQKTNSHMTAEAWKFKQPALSSTSKPEMILSPAIQNINKTPQTLGAIANNDWRCLTGLSPPVKYFTDRSEAELLLWILYVFLSCVCYAFEHVCLYVPCGHLLLKVCPLGSRLWCLTVSLSLSHWYPW